MVREGGGKVWCFGVLCGRPTGPLQEGERILSYQRQPKFCRYYCLLSVLGVCSNKVSVDFFLDVCITQGSSQLKSSVNLTRDTEVSDFVNHNQ